MTSNLSRVYAASRTMVGVLGWLQVSQVLVLQIPLGLGRQGHPASQMCQIKWSGPS